MSSGIGLNPDVAVKFDEMKKKKKFSMISLKIGTKENSTIHEVQVEKTWDKTESDEQTKKLLKDCINDWHSEPRFILVDFCKGELATLFPVFWSPDSAKVKLKMIYSGTVSDMWDSLPGCPKTRLEIHSFDELEDHKEMQTVKCFRNEPSQQKV